MIFSCQKKDMDVLIRVYDYNQEPNTYSVMCAYAIKAIRVVDIYVSVLTNYTPYFPWLHINRH